jgi:hypothetical protein
VPERVLSTSLDPRDLYLAEGQPEMMEEKGNLVKSAERRCPNETTAIEIELCRAPSSIREHLPFSHREERSDYRGQLTERFLAWHRV